MSWKDDIIHFLSEDEGRIVKKYGSRRMTNYGVARGRNIEYESSDLHLILYIDTTGMFSDTELLNSFLSSFPNVFESCDNPYYRRISVNLFADNVYSKSGCKDINDITTIQNVENGSSNIENVYLHIYDNYSYDGNSVEENIDSIIIVSDNSLAISNVDNYSDYFEDFSDRIMYLLPGVVINSHDGYINDAIINNPPIEDFL